MQEWVKGATECRRKGERAGLLFFKVRTNHANGASLQATRLSEEGVEQVIFPFKYCHGMLGTWDKM